MNTLRELPPDMLHRFTHPDFEHDLALVALDGDGPDARQIGVARVAVDSDGDNGEFAMAVADAWQTAASARALSASCCAPRALGLKQVWGDILASNRPMSGSWLRSASLCALHPRIRRCGERSKSSATSRPQPKEIDSMLRDSLATRIVGYRS